MLSQRTSRWFGLLILLMLGLRVGYKYYRSQQKPSSEVMMEQAAARGDALVQAIKADQAAARARGFVPVLADSSVRANDTTVQNE